MNFLNNRKNLIKLIGAIALLLVITYLINSPLIFKRHLIVEDLDLLSFRWKDNNHVLGFSKNEQEEQGITELYSINVHTGNSKLIWSNPDVNSHRWLSPSKVLIGLEGVHYQLGHYYLLDTQTLNLTPLYLPDFTNKTALHPNQDLLAYLATTEDNLKTINIYSLESERVTKRMDISNYLSGALIATEVGWVDETTVYLVVPYTPTAIVDHLVLFINTENYQISVMDLQKYVAHPIFLDQDRLIAYRNGKGLIYLDNANNIESVISPIQFYANVNYQWIDNTNVAYFEIIQNNENDYTANLYRSNLYKLDTPNLLHSFKFDQYSGAPLILVSLDHKRAAYLNPSGQLEIHRF